MAENWLEDERERYHFHFTSTELYEDFVGLVAEEIKSVLDELKIMVIGKFPESEAEITAQIDTLSDLYLITARETLQKFKEVSKEILKLPPDVVFPGYGDVKPVTSEELDALKVEVERLEKEYVKEKYYRAMLQAQLKTLQEVWPLYEKVANVLKFYKDNRPKPGEKSLQELFDVLDSCEKFYHEKKGKDQQEAIIDEFNLFKTK